MKCFFMAILLAFINIGCVVETHLIRVDKDYWLANQYLQKGKEPPIITTSKVIEPTSWVTFLNLFKGINKDYLNYNKDMYYENTTTYYFLRRNNVIPEKAFEIIR